MLFMSLQLSHLSESQDYPTGHELVLRQDKGGFNRSRYREASVLGSGPYLFNRAVLGIPSDSITAIVTCPKW